MPATSATGNGQPSSIVISAAAYAPMPMNAALPIDSIPHDSVSQIDSASRPLMPIVRTRLL